MKHIASYIAILAVVSFLSGCNKKIDGMVFVKGGTFQMGSNTGHANEAPAHSVTVSDFYIDKYEVTVKQYREFCNATGRAMPEAPSWGWHDDHPIVNVSWFDADSYANWVGKQLPTEAEWEYAAKGGNQSKGFEYSGSSKLVEVGWCSINSFNQTHPVGQLYSNEIGIHDMTGNAMEWCSDWYAKDYYSISPSDNPQGPRSGSDRVLRGGAWNFDSYFCVVTLRGWIPPTDRSFNFGFRCVKRKK